MISYKKIKEIADKHCARWAEAEKNRKAKLAKPTITQNKRRVIEEHQKLIHKKDDYLDY